MANMATLAPFERDAASFQLLGLRFDAGEQEDV